MTAKAERSKTWTKGKFVMSCINGTYKLRLVDSSGQYVVLHIREAKVFMVTGDNKNGTL